MIRSFLRRFLRLLGKSDRPVIAVFAASNDAWRDALSYLRREVPQFPVWLVVAGGAPGSEPSTCERVLHLDPGPAMPLRAAGLLWSQWVVLSVVTYTREPGYTSLKIAPFFVPPWKLLIMNEQRDFFAGLPFGLLVHGLRRLRDRAATAAESAKDLLLGVFWKMTWTLLDPLLLLTSRPWVHPQEPPALADPPADTPEPYMEPYILFHDGPDPAPADLGPLRALFDRPDTFAASFQPGRAGFQRDILPRAAFRTLQPGEASAVLAPLSGAVLVDAVKLARLGGFPRARRRRCQWLLLYWRALRAGWKSYSVGGGAPRLPLIPDRGFPEAEFCCRLLAESPRPRAIPGAGLEALRGSIATHPAFARPFRPGRRRLLILSPYLPFPLTHGGAVRIFHLSQCLVDTYDLILLTFRERGDQVDYQRLGSCFARVLVVDHDERRRPDPSVPEPVAQFRSRAMAAALRQAAAEFSPDLLQIEYTHLASYRDVLPGIPAVLVEHDVTFSLYEQIWQAERSSEARAQSDLWYRYESSWLPRFDGVAVMSRPEQEKAVAAGASAARTFVVPNGVDIARFQPAGEPADPPEILFVGSFRHLPNLLAFRHLHAEILPRLWRRHPQVRLRVIAGPEYHKYWDGTPDPRVTLEAFVADPAPRYTRAAVVVVPLLVSAGTNIKVMEALACGRPVVSTSVGCTGLDLVDGEELLIADGPEAFTAAVERLLSDSALRLRLSQNGRHAACERFDWRHCALAAREMYDRLLKI